MKTIKEWFESVENPILRKVLLMRMTKLIHQQNQQVGSLSIAVEEGINWYSSKEGYHFWQQVFDDLLISNESSLFNFTYPVLKVEWLNENDCIHCETKEDADKICKLMNKTKLPFYWYENANEYYPLFNDKTCFFVKEGKVGDLDFALKNNYTIYSSKLFIKK